MYEGHSASQLLNQMHDRLILDESLSDKQKAVVFERFAVSPVMLVDSVQNPKFCDLIRSFFRSKAPISSALSRYRPQMTSQSMYLQIVDQRLMDGADEFLQIMDLCTVLMAQICHRQ